MTLDFIFSLFHQATLRDGTDLGLRAGTASILSSRLLSLKKMASLHDRTADAQILRLRDEVDGVITMVPAVEHAAEARYKQEVPLLQMELGTNNERIRELQRANRVVEKKITELRDAYHAAREKRYGAEQSYRRSSENAVSGPIYTVLIFISHRSK